MVGGGQLARMTQQSAIALGIDLRILARTPEDSAARVVGNVQLGDDRSLTDIRTFAKSCDVVTFDHEHVPDSVLRQLTAEEFRLRPGRAALRHAQDKLRMRTRNTELGMPNPRWQAVSNIDQVTSFAAETGWPVIIKAARGGYDGKGVWPVSDEAEAAAVVRRAVQESIPLLVEERVRFRRELAVQVARSPHGQAAVYPVVETRQRDGICHEVVAPAPGLDDERAAQAQQVAVELAHALDVVGLLAVELFETDTGVVVNELAMRPHNSGHWTIDGAATSQFEQHLRAVLNLPLGRPDALAPVTVMANVLGGQDPDVHGRLVHVLAKDPDVKVHLYGKEVRPGRKIGHVTVRGSDPADLVARAQDAAAHLNGNGVEDE
ncbi:5-(carboxyamino)imidazole ribonucleotide synthase [Lipingzhangella rawalii]